ncbi:Peroxidasin [Blattella germanica]|nr:Peroxidasin [Blattella germanica]
MNILRAFSGGKLNVTKNSARGKPLMPQITTHPECKSSSKVCFRAGDARASEQPGLAALHTLFLREHNRLTENLSKLNPHWGDEKLYQTGRRILSAVTQHFTFREFLPRLFGWDGVHRHGLTLQTEGYFQGYEPDCDATIVNEFAAAAFRFGHSLLRPTLLRMDEDYGEKKPEVRLRDTFFNPEVLYQADMVDELIRGLAATAMETLDQFITNEVTNHLFEDRRMPYSGMDLAAINIQRARDHGIPGYNEYRAWCNLTRARDFDDLKREIPSPLVENLRRLYIHVDDIDLFPGGLAETPLMGGVVGPTFACIIGHQFRLLRRCDRFWYENDDPLVRFTEAQLADIRKVTLSRLVCDNCDHVSKIQRSLLDLADPFL